MKSVAVVETNRYSDVHFQGESYYIQGNIIVEMEAPGIKPRKS